MHIVATYLIYLVLSIAVTVGVARTLHRNGRVFLLNSFNGDATLADSVNHLLVVGFYLINVGFVALALRTRMEPSNLRGTIEVLSTKMGITLLVLGMMHFFNLFVIWLVSTMSRSREAKTAGQST